MWFIQGDKFNEWKKNGSLLWIRGNRKLLFSCQNYISLKFFVVIQRALARVYFGMQFPNDPSNTNLIVLSSSAVIEDIKHLQESSSALVAYYYFDFKDVAKRDVRGLLASLLLQLVGDSDSYWDTLHQLYKACRDGSEQPSEPALVKCHDRSPTASPDLPCFRCIG